MNLKLKEAAFSEIRHGNTLIVLCQGEHKCAGSIRIPFLPTLEGASPAEPNPNCEQKYWNRISGKTLDDLTLDPSIDAGNCGHFHITNGEICPA